MEQRIQIDNKHISLVFKLPCVKSIHKQNGSFFVVTYDGEVAEPSNWLVEENGKWRIER